MAWVALHLLRCLACAASSSSSFTTTIAITTITTCSSSTRRNAHSGQNPHAVGDGGKRMVPVQAPPVDAPVVLLASSGSPQKIVCFPPGQRRWRSERWMGTRDDEQR
jgi:hypothetical protein